MAHIADAVLEQVRRDGFAVMEGFLAPDELAAAQAGVAREFPTHDEYFADPARHARVVRHPFAGLALGPFKSWDLNRVAFHPDLVDAAERFCGTTDLQLYKIELWAKYSGAADYDQDHHYDYANHSLVVPRRDGRWPQLTTFVLLSDVDEDSGPTRVIPRAVGDAVELVPQAERPAGLAEALTAQVGPGELREHEVAITGPAGSIFLYTTDVLHRGSAMTGHPRSRFVLLADYSERANPWMGKMAWPQQAVRPGWNDLMVRATPRERELFGFPPPGHPYWNDQTRRDVGRRYPGMDLSPYRPG